MELVYSKSVNKMSTGQYSTFINKNCKQMDLGSSIYYPS